MNSLDSLSPSALVSHLFHLFLQTASNVYTKLMSKSHCWSANNVCGRPQENFDFGFVPASTAVFNISCSLNLNDLSDGRQVAVKLPFFGDATSRICSKWNITSLCSSHRAFSRHTLLKSRWCKHTIVLAWLPLGRIPILFYQWN